MGRGGAPLTIYLNQAYDMRYCVTHALQAGGMN